MTAFQMRILSNSLTSPWLAVAKLGPECAIIPSIISCAMSTQPLEWGEYMIRTQDSTEEILALVSFSNLRERKRWLLFELIHTAAGDSK